MEEVTSDLQYRSHLGSEPLLPPFIKSNIRVVSRPSIRVLELARSRNGNVILRQCAEIPEASRIVYLKGSRLFFACLQGDDTWPTMMNLTDGGKLQLCYSGSGGKGDPFPLPLVSTSRLTRWSKASNNVTK